MTTRTDSTAAADNALLSALCWPSSRSQPHLPGWPLRDLRAGLGNLFEHAILHKVLCLLADRLITTGLDRDLPRSISRFLDSTLRANQYKTSIYRAEAIRIMIAFGEVGLTAAVLNGIAAEFSLYSGRGARQFSDIDLLVPPADLTAARAVLAALGYSGSDKNTALARHLDDILVPRITADLTSSVLYAHSEHDIREILSRRTRQPLPVSDQPLPILAAPDALLHCLARISKAAPMPWDADAPRWSICADALRLVRVCTQVPAAHLEPALAVPAAAATGWARLRRIWPDLPPTPFSPSGGPDIGMNVIAGRK